ncbi:hypothetical protein [Microseira wollei]|uniref:hypothetical protein n=1 Tax=Microseira wollei TaxID=467598 RepID=UPI001CFD3986|nr:hypothetical protein [Microseira wollei]
MAAKAAKESVAAPLRVSALAKVWLEKPGFTGFKKPGFLEKPGFWGGAICLP